jgi:hypothetical protein
MKITKRSISDGIGGLAFIFFLVWIYCVFKPADKMPPLAMYENYFWILFFLTALIGIVWGCFEVYFEPQRHSYLEDRVVDNRFFCCISGTSQVVLSMCILAGTIVVDPSRELFYLWIIFVVLLLYRGLKFRHAAFNY